MSYYGSGESSPPRVPIVAAGTRSKENGQMRMCVDYRQLNANSISDAYSLPRINHILERLRKARFVSSPDPKNGYWLIPMALLDFAPARFQRSLDSVLGPAMEPYAFAYLDDIIVIGATWEEPSRGLSPTASRQPATQSGKMEVFPA